MAKANMPATNKTHSATPRTTKSGSSIVASSMGKSAAKTGAVGGSKANLDTSNYVNTSHNMGTTKHGVGEVPAYLKGK